MKKRFITAAVISCVVISVLSAQQSIETVLRKFDGAISQAAIPKAQVSIGFISYAETDTSGTVVRGCRAKSTTSTQSVGVQYSMFRIVCFHKVVAVGFNTLRYDVERTLRSNRVLNPPHE